MNLMRGLNMKKRRVPYVGAMGACWRNGSTKAWASLGQF